MKLMTGYTVLFVCSFVVFGEETVMMHVIPLSMNLLFHDVHFLHLVLGVGYLAFLFYMYSDG
jgi:hypothetical protein